MISKESLSSEITYVEKNKITHEEKKEKKHFPKNRRWGMPPITSSPTCSLKWVLVKWVSALLLQPGALQYESWLPPFAPSTTLSTRLLPNSNPWVSRGHAGSRNRFWWSRNNSVPCLNDASRCTVSAGKGGRALQRGLKAQIALLLLYNLDHVSTSCHAAVWLSTPALALSFILL